MKDGCPFCTYEGPSEIIARGTAYFGGEPFKYIVIEPLDPVTPGHRLVIPERHVDDFRTDPHLLGAMMQAAAGNAAISPEPAFNLIVSAGAEATQTIPHLHVHIVPRRPNDALALPWGVA